MIVKDYFQASCPFVWITTHETDRVIADIKSYYDFTPAMVISDNESVPYNIYSWNMIQGWKNLDGKEPDGMVDIGEALSNIPEKPSPGIFIIENFHFFAGIPGIIQQLKILRDILKLNKQHIIFISPAVDSLPLELQRDIIVLDYVLPCIESLKSLLNKLIVDINLKDYDEGIFNQACELSLGLSLFEAESTFCLALIRNNKLLNEKFLDTILEEKYQIIKKSGILEYYNVETNLSDAGGAGELKAWFNSRALAFTPEAHKFGLPLPKGVLLLGIPGTGKSLIAKSIAREWKIPLIKFDLGRVFGSLVGQSEANVRNALKTIESIGRCVVWFDEIEKAFGMGSKTTSSSDVTAKVASNILTWMQESTSGAFKVATANDISALPPELLRKGRFDEIFFVDLPTDQERNEIFSIHLKKKSRDPKLFNMAEILKDSIGFTGAEIEQAIIDGLFMAFNNNKDLETKDICQALKNTVPISRTMKSEIDALRLWAKSRARMASSTASVNIKSSGSIRSL